MENKMIIGDPKTIAVHIDVTATSDDGYFKYGAFNFILNEKFIPGIGVYFTLNTILLNLKKSLFDIERTKKLQDIDEKIELTEEAIFSSNNPNIIQIDCSELWDCGCALSLGLHKDEEIIFYSSDHGATISKIHLPRGTMANLINKLPKVIDL